jgi:protein-tyrosine-phosphatase/predicted ATP-grasp superfamily ATP-dependent carboligase
VTGGKVLVFGDDTRSFLATVRSLGRHGIAVHAAPANFRSPALRSRYIAAIHDLPPWMADGVEWVNAIEALLRAAHFDLVIPCNETALLPLQHHRAQLTPLVRLAIPDDPAIAVLFDKHETRELARQVGVPVAAGRLLRLDDTAESVLAEFGIPTVVKPRHSYSLPTLAARRKVEVVQDPLRLQRLLSECDPGETVLEQFFSGQGVGVSLLASRGRVLQAFEHHRVRENGGASFYRVSAPLTPDLVQACEAIITALRYTGLAMFEYKRNREGGWVLLEVNARPWGSMPLPLALGVDFPYRWYRLLTAGDETPAATYRAGVYGRNLLPDLRAVMAEAEARRWSPVATAWFATRRAGELLRPLAGQEVHDVLVRDDLRPGLIELADAAAALRRRVGHGLPTAAARKRRQARRQVARALRDRAAGPRVLFVCQGNICRSPFAEALLRARLGASPITVGSAGMLPQPGRPPPEIGVEAAAVHGVDLSAHRSQWLTREMAEAASLVIVFDDINRGAVLDRYPDLEVPIIRLGDVTEPADIADPVDADASEFRRVYDQIAAAIDELAALLSGPPM